MDPGTRSQLCLGRQAKKVHRLFRLQRYFGCTISNMACRYSCGGPAFSDDRCEHAKMSSSASVESSPTTPRLILPLRCLRDLRCNISSSSASLVLAWWEANLLINSASFRAQGYATNSSSYLYHLRDRRCTMTSAVTSGRTGVGTSKRPVSNRTRGLWRRG